MPTIKSSKKRLRQNEKKRKRNAIRKKGLKEIRKEIEKLISDGKNEKARELIPEFMSKADKAAAKGPYHKNKVARIKSKIMKKLKGNG